VKALWQPVQILQMKEQGNQTLLAVATSLAKDEIVKYSSNKGLFAVIKFWDSRRITEEQRKMIFATCKDIADYLGDPRELVRYDMISTYAEDAKIEFFSLSDCSLETARGLINYIMDYVMEHDIPLTGQGVDRTDDINKYLYMTIKHSKCCVCGKQGVVYNISNWNKISLCNLHHDEAKLKGLQEFEKSYKVYAIKVKEE
jgi:hypothetical protein